MKKGASHVDWVISMGIFIIYIIALFIFLRPGASVEHKPQALLDLMEEEVKNEIVVNLKETPLYVDYCIPYTVAGGSLQNSKVTVSDNKQNWEIIKVLKDSEDGSISFGNSFELECSEPMTGEYNYVLSFVPKKKEETSISLELECNSGECPAGGDADAELRATENKYIVYENWLDPSEWVEDVNNDGSKYDDLKNKFGFPQEKHFAIYFLVDDEKYDMYNYEMGPFNIWRPDQGNVYTLEWKDSYIDSSSNYGEVVVHIEIW